MPVPPAWKPLVVRARPPPARSDAGDQPQDQLLCTAVLRLLQSEVDNARFLIDGICVASNARGRGIGTALIAALCDEGRARGYTAIRLDVIDSNLRAKALYQRLGFEVLHSETIGPLRHHDVEVNHGAARFLSGNASHRETYFLPKRPAISGKSHYYVV